MESAFARKIFKEWFEGNQEAFVGIMNSKDIDTPRGHAAEIHLDLPSHTVGISVWNQGNRLEIITIDVAADSVKVEDEAYSSAEKLRARLCAFLEQLAKMRE